MGKETNDFSLGDNLGEVTIKVNGLHLRIDEDGKDVRVLSGGFVKFGFALETETAVIAAQEAFKIGDTIKYGENKGWIYAGFSTDPKSPGYEKPLLVASEDIGVMTHYEAEYVVAGLHDKGQKDRLPTVGELNQIFRTFAKKNIGGFSRNTFNSIFGIYWTVEKGGHENSGKVKDKNQYTAGNPAKFQRFSDGVQDSGSRHCRFSVRLVR